MAASVMTLTLGMALPLTVPALKDEHKEARQESGI